MTNPAVDAIGTSSNTLADPQTCNYPATGVDAGDLLINLGGNDGTGDSAVSVPSTDIITATNAQNHGIYAAYETADGDEGGTTYTVDLTGTEELQAYSICISNWSGTAPEASTLSNGSSAAPNANSITPSWSGDTLYITVCTWNGDAGGVSAWPSGYTGNQTEGQVGTVNGCAFATKTGAAGAEDAGAWTLTNSVGWQAVTIAVKGTGGEAPIIHHRRMLGMQ